MKILTLIGRLLFSIPFMTAGFFHFSDAAKGYAESQGVPAAGILVPFSGILALAGALSIITGYKAKAGAWLIVLFLVPVTLMMHKFWTISDPSVRQLQMVMFNKNLSMLGGALLICYFGSGPLSIDNRHKELI